MEKPSGSSFTGSKLSKPEPGSIEIYGIPIATIGYIAIALFLLAYAGLVMRSNRNRK